MFFFSLKQVTMADAPMESLASLSRGMMDEQQFATDFDSFQQAAKRFLEQSSVEPRTQDFVPEDYFRSFKSIPLSTLVMEHETQVSVAEIWQRYESLDSITLTIFKDDYFRLMNRVDPSPAPSTAARSETRSVDDCGFDFGDHRPTVVLHTADDDSSEQFTANYRHKKHDFSERDEKSEAIEKERLEAYILCRVENQLKQEKRDELLSRKYLERIKSMLLEHRKEDLVLAEDFIKESARKVKEARDLLSFIPTLSEQILRDQAEQTHILWSKDTPDCELCSTKFTFFTRRHHCRRCGKCVCNSCSFYIGAEPINEKTSVLQPCRICKSCHVLCLDAQKQFRNPDDAKFLRVPSRESESSVSSLEKLIDGKPRFYVFPEEDITSVTRAFDGELSNWSKIPILAHSLLEKSHYAVQQTTLAATEMVSAGYQRVAQLVRPPPAIDNTK